MAWPALCRLAAEKSNGGDGLRRDVAEIAGIFATHMTREKVIELLTEPVEQARACTECRECVERWPYDLDIPEMVKENIALFEALSQPV